MNKLNGWQRLWVVVSIIFLLIVLCFAIYEYEPLRVGPSSTFDIRTAVPVEYSQLDYYKHLASFFFTSLLIWIIPVIGLYISGLAFVWVVKGFRKK